MRYFSSKHMIRSLLLFGCGLLGYLCIFIIENIYASLTVFTLYCLSLVVHYNDRTFTHPALVFTLFYYPYSTWFVFYSLTSSSYDVGVLLLVVRYSYLGLFSFASLGIFFELENRMSQSVVTSRIINAPALHSSLIFNLLYWSIVVVLVISITVIYFSGATSKREVLDTGNLLVNLSGYLAIFLTILVSIQKKIDINNKGKFDLLDYSLIITLCVFILFYLVGGERDYMFRLIFILLVMYFHCEKVANFLMISFIFILVVLAMPLTQLFKSSVLTNFESLQFGQLGFWGGEFSSAAKNLYTIIYYDAIGGYYFLLSDFLRGLLPFSARFGMESSARWYDKTFRFDTGIEGTSGWGFSLIAEGYVIDGAVGVVVVMLIISLVLHFSYRKMNDSTYWFVFYLTTLSTSIYCIRADLANFLSQAFKVSGSAIFAIWLCTVVFRRIAKFRS